MRILRLYRVGLISASVFVLLTGLPHRTAAQTIPQDRPYEVLILDMQNTPLPQDNQIPINELCLLRYDAAAGQWQPIPFQIDERDANGSFFLGHDGLLDTLDQMVFAAKDLGDRAPLANWPDDTEARQSARYEIRITDPLAPGQESYLYLFRTTTLDKSGVPSYMQYVPSATIGRAAADTVIGTSYVQGHNPDFGLPDYLRIFDNGTASPDLLDRLKLRVNGLGGLVKLAEQSLSANNPFAIVGPVRVIREVENILDLGLFGQFSFTILIKYYPNFALVSANLPLDSSLRISLIRFSFDLSSSAGGFAFFNQANSRKIIDASPDNVATDLFIDGSVNWDVAAGTTGKIVKIMTLDVSQLANASARYYYHDAASGTADGTSDTGDGMSYGDTGALVTGSSVSGPFPLFVSNYYLPASAGMAGKAAFAAGDPDSTLGVLIAQQTANPLQINPQDILPQVFDAVPPARIATLNILERTETSVTLTWTAPGDDGNSGGAAAQYFLYFSTTPVGADTSGWIQNSAQLDNALPAPAAPGTTEQYTLTGLQPQQRHYFLLLSADEFNNLSGFSNLASEITVPVELVTFQAVVEENHIRLRWQTATESNNAGFSVQRRTGGEAHDWADIAFVEGHGTSSEPHAYVYLDRISTPGHYSYRLKQVDFDGAFDLSSEAQVEVRIPQDLQLAQNYPNPFRAGMISRINYTLPVREDNRITLRVYNLLGQEVGTLIRAEQQAGYYTISWNGTFPNGRRVSVGSYFLVLETAGRRLIKKIAILP